MIRVCNLNLKIKKHLILNNINLILNAGEISGLIGYNGCGKTMLMKCICGFVRPSSGYVVSDGRVIGKDIDYLDNAGVIIETPGFINYYSGLKNLRLLYSINNSGDIDKRIRNAMIICGLDPDDRRPVRKYSLGMRQRLGIAQAVMEDQSILILDEPMNGLDESGVNDIRDLLMELRKQGKTILIASHMKEDINLLCDKVYRMDAGALKTTDDC